MWFQLIQSGAKTVQAIDWGAIQTMDYVSGDQGRVIAARIGGSGDDDYSGRNSNVWKHLCDLVIHIDSENAQWGCWPVAKPPSDYRWRYDWNIQ